VFAALLNDRDARRASETVQAVLAHGVPCALTGGLAIAAQLRAHGRLFERRDLNDIDFVVDGFAAIPESVAAAFLLHHVHPDAIEGKTLLQLIDEATAVRVDVFRAFGNTLTRAAALDDETGGVRVVSVEDLAARTTALVCGSLQRRHTIDTKHVRAFTRLLGLGRPQELAAAWNDHRQAVPGTFEDATREAVRLLEAHAELVVVDEYSPVVVPCEQCREQGPFRPGPSGRVVQTLGYW
jgi:hypothetical protein